MNKYLMPIAITLLLSSGLASATPVNSSNQAVTVCKSHLKETVPGFKRAKLGQVRSSREHHTLTFSVKSDQGRSRTKCVVSKEDGVIALQN